MTISSALSDRSIPSSATVSLTASFALAAALAVLAMFGTYLSTGIGQDPLQYMHTPTEYAAILLKNPPMLRFVIGIDNLFIVLYSSMFLTLGAALWKQSNARPLLLTGLILLACSGVLDMVENMHFLTMISTATQSMEIGQGEIQFQVWESLLKFHVSYLGLFLLGFALPVDTALEKALSFSLRWIQLPVGLLIYLVPASLAVPLVMVRFTFFLLALLAIASIFRRYKSGSDAPVWSKA